MKAIVQRGYGRPEAVLSLEEVAQPSLGDDQVLVRVRAASVHPDVWHVVTGRPWFLRVIGSGFFRPKVKVPGTDIAGEIEAIGRNVTRFEVGDAVFGEIVRGHQWKNGGAYAEYAAVSQAMLELKPQSLSFQQAAAVPTSGLIAHQGMRDEGRVAPGDKVLVNGAGGAVGTFAVQIAKAYGAEVTAVDSPNKLAMLTTIADHVVDYTSEDFTTGTTRYDLIFDVPGNRSFDDLKRALVEGGRYVLIGHDDFGRRGNRLIGGTIGRILKLQILAPFGRRNDADSTTKTEDPLAVLAEFLETGSISPTIDSTFPLADAAKAIRFIAEGQPTGKVVLVI